MSDSNRTEILKKKRTRGKQAKLVPNKVNSKIIQKKLKLGKKSKSNSRHDIIKPKPIKKLITNQNYPPAGKNQNNILEKTFPEEEKDFKKEDSCQENSLGQLTKNFINYIKTTGKKSININDLVNELDVKKRRIYDITNVLQGIGYLQKSGKNEIVWTKTINNKVKQKKKSTQKKNSSNNKLKINKEQLDQEKERLENEINIYKDEFNTIAKKNEFAKYGYITNEDLKTLSINEKVDLLIIKATKGTVMNIVDKKDIKIAYEKVKKLMETGEMNKNEVLLNILKKNNQLIFNSPQEVGLNFYNVKNGEIKEIGTSVNNINNKNSASNISISKYVNNNFNFNNIIQNKSYNFALNYNVNINKDSPIQNDNNNNNNKNNNFFLTNNQEDLGHNIYDSKNNPNYPKSKTIFINYNEGGNNDTIPHNITVNNEQKNIGVYAIQSKSTYNQNHKYNAQKGGGYNYYKNNVDKNENNPNNNNNKSNNFIEENFSFTATPHQNKILK